MIDPNIAQHRTEVITRFINLETMINSIICNYYMHKLDKNFILDILYDENFTFSLRRNILFKILKRLKISGKELEPLYRLNTIRNYFAHVNQHIIDISGKARIPDPKDSEKGVNFEELYKEYVEKDKVVCKHLYEIIQNMKIDGLDVTTVKSPDMKNRDK